MESAIHTHVIHVQTIIAKYQSILPETRSMLTSEDDKKQLVQVFFKYKPK